MKRYNQKPKAKAIKNLLQIYAFIGDAARQEKEKEKTSPQQPDSEKNKNQYRDNGI